MFRILKYPIGYEKGRPYGWVPEGKCIRIDWIKDQIYHGFFCWIIVDTNNLVFEKRFLTYPKITYPIDNIRVQLGVLEDQYIETDLPTEPKLVFIDKGKIYLSLDHKTYGDTSHRIIGCKTGSTVDIHPDNLQYLGFVPIFIKSEIVVYFFRVFK
jgi:hypothetical protein